MSKLLNLRYPLFCFIAFCFAIVVGKSVFSTNLLAVVIICIIFALLFCFCCFKKRFVVFICVSTFFLLGLLSFYIGIKNFCLKDYEEESYYISARVSDKSYEYSSSQSVILDNVSIDGERISDNIYALIYGGHYQTGDEITFNAAIVSVKAFNLGEFESYLNKNNAPYSVKVTASDIVKTGNRKSADEIARNAVKEKLMQNIDEDNAAVAFAMLFGDKSEIPKETKSAYSAAGISHLLAVSGLHVGVLTAFIFWLLKKCRANKYVQLAIIVAVLSVYCWLCGFSPSVVRASVMCVVFLLSGIFGKRYDLLTSLSISGLLILFVSPLSALDISFQMSFGCVAGIALFYRSLNGCFRKIKFPKFLAAGLSVSICAQIGILPIMFKYFNGVSILSPFLNVLVVPVFSLAFTILVISVPLLFISNFFGNVLWFVGLLLEGIKISANFIGNVPNSNVSFFTFSTIGICVYYFVLIIFSEIFLSKKYFRYFLSLFLIFIITLTTIFANNPTKFDSKNLFFIKNNNAFILTTKNNNKFLFLCDKNPDENYINEYTAKSGINDISAVILLSSHSKNTDASKNLENISAINKNTKIYYYNNINLIEIYEFLDIKIQYYLIENKIVGLNIINENKNIFICANNLSEGENSQLNVMLFNNNFYSTKSTNLLVDFNNQFSDFVQTKSPNLQNYFFAKVANTSSNFYADENYSIGQLGNFTFKFESDKIQCVRSLD